MKRVRGHLAIAKSLSVWSYIATALPLGWVVVQTATARSAQITRTTVSENAQWILSLTGTLRPSSLRSLSRVVSMLRVAIAKSLVVLRSIANVTRAGLIAPIAVPVMVARTVKRTEWRASKRVMMKRRKLVQKWTMTTRCDNALTALKMKV